MFFVRERKCKGNRLERWGTLGLWAPRVPKAAQIMKLGNKAKDDEEEETIYVGQRLGPAEATPATCDGELEHPAIGPRATAVRYMP